MVEVENVLLGVVGRRGEVDEGGVVDVVVGESARLGELQTVVRSVTQRPRPIARRRRLDEKQRAALRSHFRYVPVAVVDECEVKCFSDYID